MEGPNVFELMINAIKLRKCDKDAGTSLIVAEMLKASGVEGAQQIRDLIEDSIHFAKIPTQTGRVSSSSSTRAMTSPLSEEIIEAPDCWIRP